MPLQIKSNTATQVGEKEAHFDVLCGALVSVRFTDRASWLRTCIELRAPKALGTPHILMRRLLAQCHEGSGATSRKWDGDGLSLITPAYIHWVPPCDLSFS